MPDPSIRPHLMFQGQCEAALTCYAALIPGARIAEIARFGPDEPGPEGSVRRAIFLLGGQPVICMDSPIAHAFDFTPSFSFFVDCADEAQFDAIWAGLAEGGTALMPVADYGWSQTFGWLNDRFGVSWQINLP